jgi:hypothetical protein
MTPKQNRGAGKKRPPAVPLNYYESRAGQRDCKLFFIFCNGKITEIEYFNQLCTDLAGKNHTRSQFIYVKFAEGTPEQVVKSVNNYVTERKRSVAENDDADDIVWVVFDKDDFGKNYSNAVMLAKQSQIKVAYSNICFELWLLLHFQEQTDKITRAKLAELLRRKWEEVTGSIIENKSVVKHFPYGIIREHGNRQSAIERAENLHNTATNKRPDNPCEINPVTNVY